MKKNLRCIFFIMVTLTGCGLKGPLYMPPAELPETELPKTTHQPKGDSNTEGIQTQAVAQ